jgi:hypothetical protein
MDGISSEFVEHRIYESGRFATTLRLSFGVPIDRQTSVYDTHIPPLVFFLRFDDNACVLLNNKGEMIGTRVNGVVAAELRDVQGGPEGSGGRWSKILSLAGKVCFGWSVEGEDLHTLRT